MARKNLEGLVYCTSLTYSKTLSEISGAEVYVKWENLQKCYGGLWGNIDMELLGLLS